MTSPYSPEAEKAVLGAILLNNAVVPEAMALLVPDSFYDVRHRKLFAACLELWPKELIDPVSLYEGTGKLIDLAYISLILDDAVTSANVAYHADIVADKAIIRGILHAGQVIAEIGQADPQDARDYAQKARGLISDAGAGVGQKQGLTPLSDGLGDIASEILDGQGIPGRLKTGFDKLDSLAGGLYGNLLTVLAGRPSMGKSALALNIAINVARSDKKVAYFSLEDARPFLQRRVLSNLASVPLSGIIHGNVQTEHFPAVLDAVTLIDRLPFWLSDRGQTVAQIRQSAWALHTTAGLDLLIVDHLGYIADKGKEYEVVSEATRSMAYLAKELGIPVLLLVQLNRGQGGATDNRPTLKNLRGSGKIEEDARAVWFVHRPWYYEPKDNDPSNVEIIVAKNSHGQTGVALLHADLARMQFREMGDEY